MTISSCMHIHFVSFSFRFSHANYGSVNPNAASVLWNDMIHPFLNMTIYGAIWYQGKKYQNDKITYMINS